MAGFYGCHDDSTSVTNNLSSVTGTSILNFSNFMEGSENGANWSPSSSTDDVANMVAGTDAITIRYFQPFGVVTNKDMGSNTEDIVIKESTDVSTAADNGGPGTGVQPSDIIAISDCDSADIFQNSHTDTNTDGIVKRATGGGLTPGNAVNTVSKNYPTGSIINRFMARRYFIRESDNGTGPALWWSHVGGAEELVEGVENMQILYGEDTSGNGTANSYVTADAVTDWNSIVSVRIALLMRTLEEYGTITDENSYTLLGTVYNPTDDRRRRRIFSTTIQVRNSASE
jgi:type IV pilus assembly protein PilW